MKILNSTEDLLTTRLMKSDITTSVVVGYIQLAIFVIGSGSCWVPIKKVETGDGIFFNLVFSLGLWCIGLIVNLVRNSPKLYLLPMIGGFIFTFGNLLSVPMIKCIGLALSILIRCVVMLTTSWAGARFVPKIIWMNYVGVVLAILSIIAFVLVRPDTEKIFKNASSDETQNKLDENLCLNTDKIKTNNLNNTNFFDKLNPTVKRIVGISLAIISGIFFGSVSFTTLYIMITVENASKSGSDYTFSYFSGILQSSIFCFIIYSIIKKCKPILYPKAVVPSFSGGFIWGIANWCVLEAHGRLNQSVSFPISASGQPMIASLYGVFLFKEVKGKLNFIALGIGVALNICGAIVTALSN